MTRQLMGGEQPNPSSSLTEPERFSLASNPSRLFTWVRSHIQLNRPDSGSPHRSWPCFRTPAAPEGIQEFGRGPVPGPLTAGKQRMPQVRESLKA